MMLKSVGIFCRHLAIAEYNSAVANPDGLDVEDCKAYFTANKSFKGYPNGTYIEDPLAVWDPVQPLCFVLLKDRGDMTIVNDVVAVFKDRERTNKTKSCTHIPIISFFSLKFWYEAARNGVWYSYSRCYWEDHSCR